MPDSVVMLLSARGRWGHLPALADRIEFGDCWEWTGRLGHEGYAEVWWKGKHVSVHRLMYQFTVGAIPDGLHLDHLCRVRHCCNPDHLEPVTPAENTRRSRAGAHQRIKTHCPQGHEYDNTRLCKPCRREAVRRYRRRNR